MTLSHRLVFWSAGFVALSGVLVAQIGDRSDPPGYVQQSLVPFEAIPPSPALPPELALQSFQVEPGFRIELVASEPLVSDPVAIAFEPSGRIWAVEMRGFMHDVDGAGETLPVGRVVVLSDNDGDGKMDESKVFVDGLVMPRAITLVRDGALIGAPPFLWLFRDLDGDGRADEREVVADDYGIPVDPARPELANPEQAPNAPTWARDNWIYNSNYSTRLRRRPDGGWTREPTFTRGQWGLTQDDSGRLFYNTNADQLRGDAIPSEYIARNPRFTKAQGVNVKVALDQSVWPIRVTPGVNRGYQPQILREGRLAAFTAACAPLIYRGDALPEEFYGNAFVAEPAANLVKRNVISYEGGGLSAVPAYVQREFLASTDERFRPVYLSNAPDGALYVVDMYRGILQHRISMTSYLRRQIDERKLDVPLGLGRIYRIVAEDTPAIAPPVPRTAGEWVERLSHPNGWWRDQAQQTLVEWRAAAVKPELDALAGEGSTALGRLHALWTLAGREELDLETVQAALTDGDARVRAAAIRLAEFWLKGERGDAMLARLKEMAEDRDPHVLLQLALTLGEAVDPLADRLMVDLVAAHPDHPFLVDAAVSGLAGRESEILDLVPSNTGEKRAGGLDRFVGLLAACAFNSRVEASASHALDALLADGSPEQLLLRLKTLGEAVNYDAAAPRVPPRLEKMSETAKELATVVADLAARVLRREGQAVKRPARPLTDAERKFRVQGAVLYGINCAVCHQSDGAGRDGLAPALAQSEWVVGPEARAARILLHGLSGPIEVNSKTFVGDMPAFGFLGDDQIAAILTYIRRTWGHTAEPVTTETVANIRAETKAREQSWTAPELLKLP